MVGSASDCQVLDDAGLVTMGPLKIISDGTLNTRTAYCCDPYAAEAISPAAALATNPTPRVVATLLAGRPTHLEIQTTRPVSIC